MTGPLSLSPQAMSPTHFRMHSCSRSPRPGFALIITITLVAFLVLVLVSLAMFTRVETRVASNTQQQARARQNALMGLNVALGRLQASAGPDQRVTATADIVAGTHDDKRRWTGVWNSTTGSSAPEWLVSTTSASTLTGTAAVASALPTGNDIKLVGGHSTDTTVGGNLVRVEKLPIVSDAVPGFSNPETVGHIAWWVGDEGVKAKVSLVDPYDPATAATPPSAEQRSYRFINAQRIGVEGTDITDGTPLGNAYPINGANLRKVFDLSQFPFANPAAPASLSAVARNRFHDLGASSWSVLADVARGGLKKDLTAWIADTTSNPSGAINADADYIAPADPSDTSRYGLPKWALIRDYATTHATGSAQAPRIQTDSQQGIHPVITYARMGYNLTRAGPVGDERELRLNVMPVIALWNPTNVPIQKSSGGNPDTYYEFCVKYKPSAFVSSGATVTNGVRLKLVYYGAAGVSPHNVSETLYLGSIQINNTSFALGDPVASPATSSDAIFWRFKVNLSSDLAPGESRLFTISDSSDETRYVAGAAELSDASLGINNAVYLPYNTPLTTKQILELDPDAVNEADRPGARIFWNAEPNNDHAALTEFRLTKPVPAGISTLPAIDAYLSNDANTYHSILGLGFRWHPDTNPALFPNEIYPPANNGQLLVYQRAELIMSTSNGSGNQSSPRWLAQLNPQAPVSLRNPSPGSQVLASHESQSYIKRTDHTYTPIPDSDGTHVSTGTTVSTPSTPTNLVLREFQTAATPLFSIGQLQHVNASLLNLNPAYPIANSLPNLYVPRTATRSDALPRDYFNSNTANTYPGFPDNTRFRHIYDLSYLLNQALWDGYFFSTIPTSLTPAHLTDTSYRLPNARHRFYWRDGAPSVESLTDLRTTANAASRLLLDGGFNINSTSEQAWRAILHGRNGIAADANKNHPFSRFTVPTDPANPNRTWTGYRILSDTQIKALAKTISEEVRKRGPFLSLADFVNRRLAADETGLKGPLQAAIDATDESRFNTNATDPGSINGGSALGFSSMPVIKYPSDIGSDSEQQAIFKGDTTTSLPSTSAASSRAAFAPGYLTQADLLAALGPSLVARSDTFRIRAYGDVINPATGSTEPESRAWCEAIVQRLPDYINPALAASDPPPPDDTFGRRFQIVSFRWLSNHEL